MTDNKDAERISKRLQDAATYIKNGNAQNSKAQEYTKAYIEDVTFLLEVLNTKIKKVEENEKSSIITL